MKFPQIRICDIFKYSDDFLTLKEFSGVWKSSKSSLIIILSLFPLAFMLYNTVQIQISLIKMPLIFSHLGSKT